MSDIIQLCLDLSNQIHPEEWPLASDDFKEHAYYKWGLIELANRLMDRYDEDPSLAIHEIRDEFDLLYYNAEFVGSKSSIMFALAMYAIEDLMALLNEEELL